MPKIDTKELTCIVCPVGCKLTVEKQGDDYVVKGNVCKRGQAYAIEELTNPTRMLTSTVKVVNSRHLRLPVHTSGPIPKDRIFDAMAVINKTAVKAPVKMGEAVIRNILDTGVDICSSRTIK